MKDVERHRVITYFEIGKLLNEAGSKYGEDIIGEYSKKLMSEVGKKYTKRTLFRMRLTWSHYTELLSIENKDRLLYYLKMSVKQNLSIRE